MQFKNFDEFKDYLDKMTYNKYNLRGVYIFGADEYIDKLPLENQCYIVNNFIDDGELEKLEELAIEDLNDDDEESIEAINDTIDYLKKKYGSLAAYQVVEATSLSGQIAYSIKYNDNYIDIKKLYDYLSSINI